MRMDIITQIPGSIGIGSAMLLLLGLLFFSIACTRLRRRRWLGAGGHGLFSITLLAIAMALVAVGFNLHTYQRLTHERDVAEISFRQLAPQRFQVRIHYPDRDRYQELQLSGDAWQIDARVLKWHGPALLAGLDSGYRLERISGRYENIEAERNQTRSVHALSDNPGVDLWSLTRRFERWLPWLDAGYGSATYLPMRDDARYRISMTQSGLIARASNTAGQQAIDTWH